MIFLVDGIIKVKKEECFKEERIVIFFFKFKKDKYGKVDFV